MAPNTDIYWVQDFPITRGNNDGLPPIIEDNQPFCSTLRYFLEMLIKCKTGPDHRATLPACLNPLFAGVDFSGARGTLLASVPGKPEGVKEETNGIRGLEAALKGYSWPEGARTQPVVYITGALGKLVKDDATKEGDWVRDFRKGVGAGGKHAPDPDTLIDVRVVWPDNATVFVGDERVARSLGNNCTYYNKKVRTHARTTERGTRRSRDADESLTPIHLLPPHTRITHAALPLQHVLEGGG